MVQEVSRDKMDFVASEFSCEITVLREDQFNEEFSYSPQSLFEIYTSMFKRVRIDEPLLQLLTIIGTKVSKMAVKSSSAAHGLGHSPSAVIRSCNCCAR